MKRAKQTNICKRLSIPGRRFGRWTVLRFAGISREKSMWRCVCDCGARRIVKGNELTSGRSRSCGCYRNDRTAERSLIHGDARRGRITKEFQAWVGLIQRCTNRSHRKYPDYGGRGIRVCVRWRSSFQNFLHDVGRAPSRRYSIDRENNDGNYTPSNVRWATPSQQRRNQRATRSA